MRRRRVLWLVLACLVAPVALYALLPTAAAAGLTYVLHRQGYHHVTLQLGYPGWQTLQVPLLSFQKDVNGESLSVMVQGSRLEYDLRTLFSGRIDRLTIPHASVALRGRGGNEDQACAPSQTALAEPGWLASVTVGQLLHPLPELPWRELVVEQVHVFRECATGPLRDVRISGTLHKTGTSADGTVLFQGAGSAVYRLTFAVSHLGSLEVTLQTEPAAPGPIVALQSRVRQGLSDVQLEGRASTNFAQLAPFLDLVLPVGVDLQNVAGTMQATWTITAPAAASLATAWYEPAAVVSGTAALTLTLPKFAGVGNNLSVRFNVEVTGNAEQLVWTLSKDSRLEVELDRSVFPVLDTVQWLLPAHNRHVTLECPEPVKGQLRLADLPPQFTVEGPVRLQYGPTETPVPIEVSLQRATGQGTEHLTAAGTYRLMGALDQWAVSLAVHDAALRLEAHSTAFNAAVTLVSKLEYAFARQVGSAQLQLGPVQFDPSRLSWRKMLPLQSFPVDVTGGHLSATASLTWGPKAGTRDRRPALQTASATIMLQQLSGQYESIVVNDLTTTLHLRAAGADTLTMPEPARVTIAAVKTGVEMTDLSLDLQLGWASPTTLEWVAVHNVSAAVFGGRVTSTGGRLDFAHPDQTFTVKAAQLDLQQLLHLEQQKGLEGTGLLDGVIPVLLTPTGVQIHDGVLEARPPGGVLRYQPAPETAQEVAPADSQLSLVLQALSNFHYNVLKLGIQYEEDGTLKLAARLEGKNPDWQQGRPVHFNLTVQENIPALLKSLRVVQGIEQSLQERLQRR